MKKLLPVLFITTFVSIHFGTLLYVGSSYLNNFFPESVVSLLFVLGALEGVVVFFFTTRILRKISKGMFLTTFLFITALSCFGFSLATTKLEVLIYFFIYGPSILMIYYILDLMVEDISSDRRTGEIRGAFNTVLNLGIMIGPIFLVLFALGKNLQYVYMAAAFILLPLIFISFLGFKHTLRERFRHENLSLTSLPIRDWWVRKDIRNVTLAKLSLELFYTFMVIYTPIYLHGTLGFDWSELGVIFSIALLPFVLLTFPVGELADKWIGEKEIMSLGFFLGGGSLLVMPFLSKSYWLWMFILFVSRVGASLVEITTDVYFFKKVHPHDTGLISIFRLMRPLSNGLGAMGGLIFLSIFSIEKIFFLVTAVVLFGFIQSLSIKDTL